MDELRDRMDAALKDFEKDPLKGAGKLLAAIGESFGSGSTAPTTVTEAHRILHQYSSIMQQIPVAELAEACYKHIKETKDVSVALNIISAAELINIHLKTYFDVFSMVNHDSEKKESS